MIRLKPELSADKQTAEADVPAEVPRFHTASPREIYALFWNAD